MERAGEQLSVAHPAQIPGSLGQLSDLDYLKEWWFAEPGEPF